MMNKKLVFPWVIGISAFIALLPVIASGILATLFLNLGYVALVRGAPTNAERWFDLATQIDSDLGPAWHGLGQAAIDQGNVEFALQAYGRALSIQPGDLRARLDRAFVRQNIGDVDGAISDWRATDSAYVLLGLGHQAQSDEGIELATLFYQQAVEVEPQEWLGYYYLGAMLKNNSQYDAAEQVLMAGLKVSPGNASILFRLGQTQLALKHYEEAIMSFSSYIKFRSDDFQGWYWRGLSWEATGVMDQALHDFRQAIILNQDDPNVQLAITRALEYVNEH